MVYAPRPQALLGYHEAVPLGAKQVFPRHPAVLIQYLTVAIVVASRVSHNGDVADEVEAGGVVGNNNHACAQIRRGLGVGDRHDYGELGAVGRGGVPFLPVYHVIVAVLHRRGVHHDRVGACQLDLGHGEAASNFTIHQRPQIALLLLLGPVFMQDLDVPRVGGLAAEDVMPERRASELLRH